MQSNNVIESLLYILCLNYDKGKQTSYVMYFDSLDIIYNLSSKLRVIWRIPTSFFKSIVMLLRSSPSISRIDLVRLCYDFFEPDVGRTLECVVQFYENFRANCLRQPHNSKKTKNAKEESGCVFAQHSKLPGRTIIHVIPYSTSSSTICRIPVHPECCANKPPSLKQCLKSNDGFISSIWGPMMWWQMESVALFSNYAPSNITKTSLALTQYFDALGGILPCSYCRDNYANNRSVLRTPRYKTADETALYVYRLHNVVNKALDKKNVNVTFRDMKKKHVFSVLRRSKICIQILPRT